MSIFQKVPDHETAIKYLERIKWKRGVFCPKCKGSSVSKHVTKTRTRWQCWKCKSSFVVTSQTIFSKSYIPLNKWFYIIDLMFTKRTYTGYKLARDLEEPMANVYNMMRKIKKGMKTRDRILILNIAALGNIVVNPKAIKKTIEMLQED